MSVTENLRIESESRHAKVLMLMPRGHDPERDSQAAGVQHSTVSKDLKIRKRMKKAIRDTVTDEA